MTLIDSVSYLEEYEQVFGIKTEDEFRDRIKIVKTINKPLISRIKKWKDLKILRNQLLAHNLRQGKNGLYIFDVENLGYNAPRTVNDLFLLSNLIQFSTETINSEFLKELKTINNKNLKEVKLQANRLTKNDVSSITVALLKEANKEKEKFKRSYDFTLTGGIDWNKI